MSSPVIQIASSRAHSLALKADGTIVGWGADSFGQATAPAGLTDAIAVTAGTDFSAAIKSDNTVVAWGNNDSGKATPTAGLTDVIAISAGYDHCIALKSDGTVVGWGDNTSGQTTPPSGLTGVIAVSADNDQSLALKSDGTVVGWGLNNFGQTSIPSGLTGVEAISSGYGHGLALKSDGTVVGWGLDSFGQKTPPAGLTGVIGISAGFTHSLAVKSDGSVVGWGSDSDDQISLLSDVNDAIAVTAGQNYSTVLKSGGTVVSVGDDSSGRASPPGSIQPPVTIDIAASLSFSAFFENSADLALDSSLSFGAQFSGYQDWTTNLPALKVQEVYRLIVTGSKDGLDDLRIGGISSWQATNQAGGRSSYLQAVIPNAEAVISDISERENGELVIQKGYRFQDGSERYEEILRSEFNTLRWDRGPTRFTATVSGYLAGKVAKKSQRTLTGLRSISISNGKRRVRCNIDLFLQPGMTVTADSENFEAAYINYYVSQNDKFCEVGE